TPIPDDDFFHFLQTSFVDQHTPDRRFADNFRPSRAEAHDVTRFRHDDSFADYAGLLDDFRMTMQLPVRAVNRNEVSRLHKGRHQLQFLFARVSTHVYRRLASVRIIDFRVPPVEMVHHPADGSFVAGNMPGG